VCGLSVAFHCRKYWPLFYSVHSYCNSIQNHITYYTFTVRHCLSVVFHCRRYWQLLYSVHSYCNSIQNHITYYTFTVRHCLSVVFHCRRYWQLLYSVHSYCKVYKNRIPYYKFTVRHCTLYTRTHTCMQMFLLLNLLFSPCNKIFGSQKTSRGCPSHSFLL